MCKFRRMNCQIISLSREQSYKVVLSVFESLRSRVIEGNWSNLRYFLQADAFYISAFKRPDKAFARRDQKFPPVNWRSDTSSPYCFAHFKNSSRRGSEVRSRPVDFTIMTSHRVTLGAHADFEENTTVSSFTKLLFVILESAFCLRWHVIWKCLQGWNIGFRHERNWWAYYRYQILFWEHIRSIVKFHTLWRNYSHMWVLPPGLPVFEGMYISAPRDSHLYHRIISRKHQKRKEFSRP